MNYFADMYDQLVEETGDKSQRQIINPFVENFLGDLTAKVVLDAGCGNGYWTRKLARSANKVIAVDFTEELISKARVRGVPSNVEFMLGNIEDLPFPNNMFDVTLLNMVLLDVEDLNKVMQEISRVTINGGSVIASVTHPCFENPPNTYSLKDRQDNKIGRVINHYFQTGLIVDQQNGYQHYHHTLADYLNSFAKHSLCVEEVEEPNGAEIIHSSEKDHHPYFLITKLRKYG